MAGEKQPAALVRSALGAVYHLEKWQSQIGIKATNLICDSRNGRGAGSREQGAIMRPKVFRFRLVASIDICSYR